VVVPVKDGLKVLEAVEEAVTVGEFVTKAVGV
jgi:hypothetical protein